MIAAPVQWRLTVVAALAAAFVSTAPLVFAWHPCCLGMMGVVAGRPENLPLWIARDREFFDKARLNIEVVEYRATVELVKDLRGKRLDVGYAAALAPALEATVNSGDLQVIGGVVNVPLYYIVTAAAPTAIDKLAGLGIGTLRGDDVGRHVLARMLDAAKVSSPYAVIKEFGAFTELESALMSGTVGAVVVPPDVALRLAQKGFKATVLNREAERPLAVYGVVTSVEWVKNHAADDPRLPELMAGLIKAHAWLADPSNKEQVIRVLRERLPADLKPQAERMYQDFIAARRYIAATPEPNAVALAELVAVLASAGRLPKKDVSKELINLTPFRRGRDLKK
jgi:ABC-type nitrate/sulfonate/bicarbonate transport system substrate-binding protein